MENVLKVTIKNVYGNDTIYPACKISESFARIAGTKTLTKDAIKEIKIIGFDIEVVTPTVKI